MSKVLERLNKTQLKKDLPDIKVGDTVRVYLKTKEGETEGRSEKTQNFEGLIIAKKHGKGISATITVRKVLQGIGVERIFPIHSPLITKIEIIRKGKTRRAKLYYLRTAKGKRGKLRREEFSQAVADEEESTAEELITEKQENQTEKKEVS